MRRAARAFTLIEMLVSLGVLVIALAIVTNVFALTTRTASVASAITEAESAARSMLNDLKADLESCDPSQSVLAIVGRTQIAGLTENDVRARRPWRVLVGDPARVPGNFVPNGTIPNPADSQYSDPRADLLMFFTKRPSVSAGPPLNPGVDLFGQRLLRGDAVDNVQVMYGHGSLAALDNNFNWSNPRHIQSSNPATVFFDPPQRPVPLTDWTLVRRQALINQPGFTTAIPTPNTVAAVFQNEITRLMRCATNNPTQSADGVVFNLAAYLQNFSLAWPAAPAMPLRSPYQLTNGGSPWNALQLGLVYDLMFPNDTTRLRNHFATIAERPPTRYRSNLGLRRLPGCAWFQVEFLMPEDPRNGRNHPNPFAAREMPRWVEVPDGSTYVFVPDSQANREIVKANVMANGMPVSGGRLEGFGQIVPPPPFAPAITGPRHREVRLWPYAVRVTVRVFDHKGQLETPVTRSLVHWFD